MIRALAAQKKGDELSKYTYDPKPIGANDVRIKITHCGICHSDLHLIDNDWNVSDYPLVPGHEIIGRIEETGSEVSQLAIGDRVGVGWQRSSCLECELCVSGNENLCTSRKATCVGHHGGFAESIHIDSHFVFKIPDGLHSSYAAPLLCAGVTVYSPMKIYNLKPHHRVGVIGIGGLGHLALQFGNKYGCEVTAFSSNPEKELEAHRFGAHHFITPDDKSKMKKQSGKLDLILSTVFTDMDWDAILSTLNVDGTLCFLGVPRSPITLSVGQLMHMRRRVTSSPIGSRSTMLEMLEFAARHDVRAQVEVFKMQDANKAISKVREGTIRYRAVLEMED